MDGLKSLTEAFNKLRGALSEIEETLSELQEIDSCLAEIQKLNTSLSQTKLQQIGNNAFDIAGRYGKQASDYLTSVKNLSQAGYDAADSIAELSTAMQSAGSMTGALADNYIIAADKAYQLGGSVEQLLEVLDGVANIADNHSVQLSELAEGMSLVGSTASELGIGIDETTAALATMMSATHQSGEEAANTFETILLNVSQLSDADAGIDTSSLEQYKQACEALHVSLEETRNGITSLRDPMDVLHDLAKAYNSLLDTDARKNSLLDSLGDTSAAVSLDAFLTQYDTYEAMLQDYANGAGVLFKSAETATDTWEGSLNRLSNTWTATMGNVADSEVVVSLINTLNGLLTVVNEVTDAVGPLGSIGLGAGSLGIYEFVKNFD